MVDSHCHLDLPAFDCDRDDVLLQCKALGISKIQIPGLSVKQFNTLLSLKHESKRDKVPHLDIAAGLHPVFLAPQDPIALDSLLEEFTKLAHLHRNDIVAIGECGLDGSISTPMIYQQTVFAHQISVASQLKKPLIIHHRQSHNELIRTLKRSQFEYGGVVHAFSGSEQIAKTYIDMGFCLGIGGTITYPRAVKTRNTVKTVSLENLLLETDSPDMPVDGFQGKRNSPSQLPLIAECLAKLKNVNVADVIAITTANYDKVFLP